jgi:ABC-type transporter Mla MlaB component
MRAPFDLPADLRIYSAIDTRDALLVWVAEEASAGHDYLQISARDVKEVDGSGLQLLASLSNLGAPWRLVESSESFDNACRLMGFGQWLGKRVLKSTTDGSAT